MQAVLFLAAIGVPWFYLATGLSSGDVSNEMRKPAPRPTIKAELSSVVAFPRRFARWYGNHFAFRRALVRQHNVLKWSRLQTAPTDKIVCGRDNWVFYADSQTLTQVRGAMPFTEEEIDLWVDMLVERRAWLADRGCRYLLAVAPSKARIYPEYLPAGYEPVGPSRQDQLLAALEERTDIRFIDLGPALIDERSNDRGGDLTFYKYGTHWTERGALRGWREIVALLPEVFSEMPPAVGALERTLIEGSQGDTWSARLYLEDHLVQEDWSLALPVEPQSTPLPTSRFGKLFVGSDDQPRVMLFHDSFGTALRPLLARSCRSLMCFWRNGWELALIENEQPDLVIDLFIERKFVTFEPGGIPLPTQRWLRAGFEECTTTIWSMNADDLGQALGVKQAERPTDPYRMARMPKLSGPMGESCWIAIDVESDTGGILELLQHAPGQAADPAKQRFDAARAFVEPGRQTLFFTQTMGAGSRELWLASPEGGWTIHSAEARH